MAGRFETAIALVFAQPHHASTGTEALLGMRPRGEHGCDHLGGGLACFRRPEHASLRCPGGIVLVCLGHMGSHRAVAPPEGRTLVTGHPSALVEEFDDLRTETRLELLLDEGVGHGIGVPVDVHVIIDVHAAQFPLGICIGWGGQRSEGGTVQGLEHALAGAGEFFEGPLIEGHE